MTCPTRQLALASLLLLAHAPGARAATASFTSGFESTGSPIPASGMVLVDVDRDGVLDAVMSNGTDSASPHTMSVQHGLGDGRFAPAVSYATAFFPMAVAAGDLNGDGWPDVVTANRGSSSLSVFLNRGDGTFFPRVNYPVGSGPRSVAIGDVDGDGRMDLVSGNSTAGTISVLEGDGAGGFGARVDRPSAAGVQSVHVVDWNGDGAADVLGAGYGNNTIAIHLGNGDGTLANVQLFAEPAAPISIDTGDLDGNGLLDLAVAWNAATQVSVFLNDGNGGLGPRTQYDLASTGNSIAIGDVTGDGIPDLAVTSWNSGSDAVSILPGVGGGAFGARRDLSTGGKPIQVAIGDVNGDARRDLVAVCAGSATITSHLANANGSFGTKRDLAPHGSVGELQAVDLDEDGKTDLVGPAQNAIAFWHGNGDGTFAAPRSYSTPGAAWGQLQFADMNGDGHLDAITINGNTRNMVWISYGTGTGTFSSSMALTVPEYQVECATPVDVDKDGRMDLVVGEDWVYSNVHIFRQTSPGHFDLSGFTFTFNNSAEYVYQVSAGDVTGDGWPDLLLSTTHGQALAPSIGGGAFGPVSYLPGPSNGKANLTDLNGDGKLDYAVISSPSVVSSYLGHDDGTFTFAGSFPTGGGNTWLSVKDLDRDGAPDLIVAEGTNVPGAPNCLSILRNRGDGTFDPHVELGVNLGPGPSTAADLDGDGWPELIANGQTISVLDNLLAPVVGVPALPLRPDAGIALAPPAPNPTRGAVLLAVTLPQAGSLSAQVYDVAGRMVWHEDRAGLAAGPQRLRIDAGSRLAPGLYFVRVSQGKNTATTRFVVSE